MINSERNEEVIKQIEKTEDPEALCAFIAKHTESLTKLTKEIAKVQAEIVKNIIPILTLPSPTPTSIVSWIGKLVAGTAIPQQKAFIKYTVQMAEISAEISKVIVAVQKATDSIADGIPCKVELVNAITQIRDFEDQLNSATDLALYTIDTLQSGINNIAGSSISNFDTSSVTSLVANYAENLIDLDAQTTTFIETPPAE